MVDVLPYCGYDFRETASVDEMVHFNDEENIVTHVHFHCGKPFSNEAAIKVSHINLEFKNITTSCKNSTSIHVKVNTTVPLMRTIRPTFFWGPTVFRT